MARFVFGLVTFTVLLLVCSPLFHLLLVFFLLFLLLWFGTRL